MPELTILSINPGSTSTKIALYQYKDKKHKRLFQENITHSNEALKDFNRIIEQYAFRANIILDTLNAQGYSLDDLDCVVGRGGLLHAIPSGTYTVNEAMVRDIHKKDTLEHASNLGCLLAKNIADKTGKPAFIVDPVVVDEFADIARFSGLPEFPRTSIFHALNQKAMARKLAEDIGRGYEELNLIVVHLGGGITVGAHKQGQVVDVNNGLTGEGPFTPERSGGIAAYDIISLCFQPGMTPEKAKKHLTGKGGMVAYLGTNDMREVEALIDQGNKQAEELFYAMCYQISKEIGAMAAAVFAGKVDYILLTGGIAFDKRLVNYVADKTAYIAPVKVYPGEDEMMALYLGALRVMLKLEQAKTYE